MPRGEHTGHGRAANRRRKLLELIENDPSQADQWSEIIRLLEQRLRNNQCCIGCGRQLKDEDSIARGYGEECFQRTMEE